MNCIELSNFWRFLHWGPITALVIIKFITFTTLYMNSMLWPPNQSIGAFLNQAVFVVLSSLATFNYAMATLTGPGVLPKEWKPQDARTTEYLQYCSVCKGYKAPRSHHCRQCNRCIKKMDHHCPWINNCVGWANHGYFTLFLIFSICGSLHGAIILCTVFIRGLFYHQYLIQGLVHLATVRLTMTSIILCVFALGTAIGVVVSLSMLLYFQIKSILKNQTGIEAWIVEKANYRRFHYAPIEDDFIYPYNLGWYKNMQQVFNHKDLMKSDGIEWPVINGCDQYTLTREQIAQKCEKRARTRSYKCIRAATGSWLPLWSQGFRVCLSPPCTEEPRIKLQPGDIIKVTRFRKHWLFGEKVLNKGDNISYDQGRQRGWFPRRCAIELIEFEPEQDWSINNLMESMEQYHKIKEKPQNGYNYKKIY